MEKNAGNYMPDSHKTEWATIGIIVALFGIHGELKVRSLTDIPNRFAELDAVHVGPEGRRYVIERTRPYKGEMVILKLKGIDDANAAEALRKAELRIPVSELARLPSDSYYQHDILGLAVYTLAGRALGPIVDIIVTGSNDVYVMRGADGKQLLIPAIKAVIKQVDLVRRVMYIDPLPGLLEGAVEVRDDVIDDDDGQGEEGGADDGGDEQDEEERL
jgi:16S rRNA processing protein RimM